MYKVIKFFTDLQDNSHPYNVGDVFPRDGKDVAAERLEELAGSENRQGVPLIEFVEEPKEPEEEPDQEPDEGSEESEESEDEPEKPTQNRRQRGRKRK